MITLTHFNITFIKIYILSCAKTLFLEETPSHMFERWAEVPPGGILSYC